ncbi:peptidase family S58-domain-containing protein [Xylariales sp. AK1849]|nr:peptidase family S58-domain-containing protein [Xylariales sp. AK1849]
MSRPHIRELGYGPGYYTPGTQNSILDVPGVQVGQKTIHDDEKGVHVGVTLIYPRGTQNTRLQPSYAAIHTLNGGGEMTGTHFIKDWGFTSSPVAFTDSMSCGAVYQALTNYSWETSRQLDEGTEAGYNHHGWPVVAETWGGGNTDIHDFKSTLSYEQIVEAIKDADKRQHVLEGGHGGGAGMLCMGHKGGTGTSSRIVPRSGGNGEDFVVGVLVQTNFGQKSMLNIGGVPIGKLLYRDEVQGGKQKIDDDIPSRTERTGSEGSIVVCVVTNAPLLPHQLKRVAARASNGIVAVGGLGTGYNSSGDIIIALSTSRDCAPQVAMKHPWQRPTPLTTGVAGGRPSAPAGQVSGAGFRRGVETQTVETVVHSSIDAIFVATGEATEEAILNSLCQAEDLKAFDGTIHKALDVERVRELLEKHRVQ